MRTKVLITGVYGLIGNVVYRRLTASPTTYDVYGLARRRHSSDRIAESDLQVVPEDHFFLADLTDFEGVKRAVADMDVVVHLAADPSGMSGWESLMKSNLVGAYHVFEASRLASVKRVVFASSVQVSFGYRDTEPYKTLFEARYDDVDADALPAITRHDPPRPLNLYASSKVWGEGLAHTYAHRHGLSCLVLRIGWVVAEDRPPSPVGRNQWCSQRDIVQIIQRCVDAPDDLRFDIFYGVSDNAYNWVDMEHARHVLGYEPQDHAD